MTKHVLRLRLKVAWLKSAQVTYQVLIVPWAESILYLRFSQGGNEEVEDAGVHDVSIVLPIVVSNNAVPLLAQSAPNTAPACSVYQSTIYLHFSGRGCHWMVFSV